MIESLLRSALRQRFVTIALTLALIGVGIWAFRQLKVEAYPDISDTQAVVITLYPGHAAEEVEQQVTVPIERALNSVPSVIARRSRTIFGLSVVELTFAYGTDDYFARQVVLEKLRDAEIPDGVTPTLGPMATPIGELYRYVVEGEGYSDIELRELEDWVVEPRFRQVSGRGRRDPLRRPGQTVPDRDRPAARWRSTTSPSARSRRPSAPTTRTPAGPCWITGSNPW